MLLQTKQIQINQNNPAKTRSAHCICIYPLFLQFVLQQISMYALIYYLFSFNSLIPYLFYFISSFNISKLVSYFQNIIKQMSFMMPSNNSQTIFQKQLLISVKINNIQQQDHPITISIIAFKNVLNPLAQKYKISFTSEQDLYFFYTMDLEKQTLQDFNAKYRIKASNMNQFIQMLENLILEVSINKKQANLKFVNENTLNFEIYNVFNAKRFILIQLQGIKQSQQQIQNWTAFKYGQIRDQINKYETKISQLKDLVKVKNPYLLHFFDKI